MHILFDQIQTRVQQVSGPSNRLYYSRGDAPSISDVLFSSINEINNTQVEVKSKTEQWMSG